MTERLNDQTEHPVYEEKIGMIRDLINAGLEAYDKQRMTDVLKEAAERMTEPAEPGICTPREHPRKSDTDRCYCGAFKFRQHRVYGQRQGVREAVRRLRQIEAGKLTGPAVTEAARTTAERLLRPASVTISAVVDTPATAEILAGD
jgi:hypothetical protein